MASPLVFHELQLHDNVPMSMTDGQKSDGSMIEINGLTDGNYASWTIDQISETMSTDSVILSRDSMALASGTCCIPS